MGLPDEAVRSQGEGTAIERPTSDSTLIAASWRDSRARCGRALGRNEREAPNRSKYILTQPYQARLPTLFVRAAMIAKA